jgi:hypothetical protein
VAGGEDDLAAMFDKLVAQTSGGGADAAGGAFKVGAFLSATLTGARRCWWLSLRSFMRVRALQKPLGPPDPCRLSPPLPPSPSPPQA